VRFGRGDLIDALIADIHQHTSARVLTTDFKLETCRPTCHEFQGGRRTWPPARDGPQPGDVAGGVGGQARQSFQRMAERRRRRQRAGGGAGGVRQAPTARRRRLRRANPAPAAPAAPAATNITSWTFGELPELLEISQGKLTLIGFPALVDKGTHCDLEVFDDPNVAARTHRIGLRRLFALQFKDQLKFAEKNIPGLQQMGMQFMSVGSPEELREQIVNKAIDIACLQDPLPTMPRPSTSARTRARAASAS
jgi:ATP-dependent helicase HrpA